MLQPISLKTAEDLKGLIQTLRVSDAIVVDEKENLHRITTSPNELAERFLLLETGETILTDAILNTPDDVLVRAAKTSPKVMTKRGSKVNYMTVKAAYRAAQTDIGKAGLRNVFLYNTPLADALSSANVLPNKILNFAPHSPFCGLSRSLCIYPIILPRANSEDTYDFSSIVQYAEHASLQHPFTYQALTSEQVIHNKVLDELIQLHFRQLLVKRKRFIELKGQVNNEQHQEQLADTIQHLDEKLAAYLQKLDAEEKFWQQRLDNSKQAQKNADQLYQQSKVAYDALLLKHPGVKNINRSSAIDSKVKNFLTKRQRVNRLNKALRIACLIAIPLLTVAFITVAVMTSPILIPLILPVIGLNAALLGGFVLYLAILTFCLFSPTMIGVAITKIFNEDNISSTKYHVTKDAADIKEHLKVVKKLKKCDAAVSLCEKMLDAMKSRCKTFKCLSRMPKENNENAVPAKDKYKVKEALRNSSHFKPERQQQDTQVHVEQFIGRAPLVVKFN